jgi:SecD/SecF fusion protein
MARAGRAVCGGAIVLAVLVTASCGGGGDKSAEGCGTTHPAHAQVYRASPLPGVPVTPARVAETVEALCRRRKRSGNGDFSVHRVGPDEIEVGSKKAPADRIVGAAQLEFYDWEPNLRPPSQVQPTLLIYSAAQTASRQKPSADADDLPPGGPSDAVRTRFGDDARKVQEYYDRQNDTSGDKYYLFGPGAGLKRQLIRPGQASAGANDATSAYGSCAEIEADFRRAAAGSTGAGPPARGSACAATLTALAKKGTGPPPGSLVLKVPRGIVVLKDEPRAPGGPSLGYWVLEDDSELSGADITDPKQGFDPQTSEPIVSFQFTPRGRAAFARVTRREAERGQQVLRRARQSPEDTFQHFAIALDDVLVSLATINYIDNPEGVSGDTGAQINGLGNIQETRDLVANLADGPLPLALVLVRTR